MTTAVAPTAYRAAIEARDPAALAASVREAIARLNINLVNFASL